MDPQLAWYTARAAGIVALGLASASVIWGLLLSTNVLQGRPSKPWLLDLHRFLGGATVIFTGIHLAGLVADTYVHFGVADLLVPFASSWRTGAVAAGVVAFYLLLAVELSSLVMRRIPRRWWKGIHLTSYGVFFIGMIHGALAGTDSGNPIYIGSMVALIALVTGLTVHRVLTARKFRGVFTDQPATGRSTTRAAPPSSALSA